MYSRLLRPIMLASLLTLAACASHEPVRSAYAGTAYAAPAPSWDYGWPYYNGTGFAFIGGDFDHRFHDHDFDHFHRGFRGGGFHDGGSHSFHTGGFHGGGFHGGGGRR